MPATAGQQFTAAIRRRCHIGPRTRWDREWIGSDSDTYDELLHHHHISLIEPPPPGYSTDQIALLRLAAAAWIATFHAANPNPEPYGNDRNETAALTPWQWTARLGEMVDAGVTTVEQARAWFVKNA